MNNLLHRIGLAAARRPWRFLAGWLVAAALVLGLAGVAGGTFQNDFTLPGTDVQRATDLLDERFPEQSGTSVHIVVHAPDEAILPREPLQDVVARAGRMERVSTAGPAQLSPDGRTAVIRVLYDVQLAELVPLDELAALKEAAEPARDAGLVTEYGGQAIDQIFEQGRSEGLGFLLAGIILLVSFGSVVAAGLPLAVSAVGLGVGMALVTLLASVVRVSTLSPSLAAMVGIGVGVDYALLVVSRHRGQLLAGMTVPESVAAAMATAGRSVVFAGSTVLVSICGLALSGSRNFLTTGFATAIVVAISVLTALTLLPALLGLAGRRVLSRRTRRELAAGTWRPPTRQPLAARWGAQAARRPWPYLLGSTALLLLLAAPVLGMQLGQGDAGNEPTSKTNRRAYDLIATSFGPGANGPLTIAVDLKRAAVDLAELTDEIASTPGVASVQPPILNRSGDTAVITALPTTSPQDQATNDLVRRLQRQVLPPGTGVTGPTAGFMAFNSVIEQNLPKVIGVVVLVSFLLLILVFRSVVAPLKAAVMNLLSVGAAYGAVVALFQWGWGTRLLGLEHAVPVNAFVPMVMFAVLFGLSMDYEVFLLSRVREEWDRTHDARASVVAGLADTGRVITSAAFIMVAVFAGFGLNDLMAVKMMGVGMATAVLVDATLVRLVLVPSTMVLLGRWNWWLPGWLDRRLPALRVELPAQAPASDASQDRERVPVSA